MARAIYGLTLFSALGSGLIAGVFFACSTLVMPALARLPPEQGIAAMQSINVAVINPWFGAAFFGTAVACLLLAIAALFRWHAPRPIWLLAGVVLYVVGTFAMTIVFNVPLNDALAVVQPASTDGANLWTRYVPGWTGWNHVRTAASFLASASFVMALR